MEVFDSDFVSEVQDIQSDFVSETPDFQSDFALEEQEFETDFETNEDVVMFEPEFSDGDTSYDTDFESVVDNPGGGSGEPGFSPTVDVEEIENGHRVTITDIEGTETFDVMNGKNGYTPVKGKDYFTYDDKSEIIKELAKSFDTDNNGQVDKADDSEKLGGKSPEYYAKANDLKNCVPSSKVGAASGVASLDENGKIPESQMPDTEIPSHKHEIDDINGLNNALNDKAKSKHQHTTDDISDFADKMSKKAESEHKHTASDISDFTAEMSKKAESDHKHTTADISDFDSEMEKKAEVEHQHTTSDISDFATEMSKKADVATVESAVENMTAIAQGKCVSYVFNTVDALDTWLGNAENIAKLKTGDVFLIRAVDVPDYWWDGETNSKQILETTKVDLTEIETALDNKSEKGHKHVADDVSGFANVATSGSYNDLKDKPSGYSHPTTHPASMITGLSTVATTGSFNDLKDKPGFVSKTEVQAMFTAFANEYLGGYKWRVGDTPADGYVTVKKG